MNKYDGYKKYKEVFDHQYEQAVDQVNRILENEAGWKVLDVQLGSPTIYLLGHK